MGFCHVGQAGLELLASSDPPALALQSAGITVNQDHATALHPGDRMRLRLKKTPQKPAIITVFHMFKKSPVEIWKI